MKRILFPNDDKYLVALTGIPSIHYLGSPKEINFSSRINQFTESGTLIKYSPSFSEMEGLMEYKQLPDSDAGRKEVENLESLVKAARLKKSKTSNAHNIGFFWIAASTIILIVVLTALIHHIKIREINEIYESSFVIPSSGFILSDANLPFNLEWELSLSAYNQKDYPKAIAGFSSMENALFYSPYAHFFKGVSYMLGSQYPQAIEVFESIDPSASIYTRAKWYVGLCNLKLNRINAARVIFSELTVSKDLTKNASEILLKLESID